MNQDQEARFKITPLPKQKEFITSTSRFSCYSGGWGSGKTVAGCLRGLMLSSYPGNFGLIGRNTYRELADTTRRTFFELCPPEYYDSANGGEWRRSENHLKLINGSEIIFRHLDDIAEQELLSLNLGWFYFDQAEEISERVFTTLISRLRLNSVPTRYGFVTCNPEPGNWIYHRWKKPIEDGKPLKNHHLVEATTYENKEHLPPDYVQSLEALPEEVQRRFVLGEWEVFEGQIYPEFNKQVHVVQPFKVPETWERLIAIDHGMTNPTAVLLGAIDYDGNLFIIDEYYSPGIVSDHAKAIYNMIEGQEISFWLIDPSTRAKTREKNGMPWSVLEEYEDQGIYATPANNELLGGINRIREFLRTDPKRRHPRTGELGSPRLFVFANCVNLINEFPQYQWKKMRNITTRNAPEVPRDYMDHALDACFGGKTNVLTKTGLKKIKDIKVGEFVWSPFGWNEVYSAGSTGVKKVRDYGVFKATPDHKILTTDGLKEVDTLGYADKIMIWDKPRSWSLMELLIGVTQTPSVEVMRFILGAVGKKAWVARQVFYTEMYGNTLRAKFLKVTWFIILTAILGIMTLAILSLLLIVNTLKGINGVIGKAWRNISIKLDPLRRNGTGQRKEENGTHCMEKMFGKKENMFLRNAMFVVKNTEHDVLNEVNTATKTVKRQPLEEEEVFNLGTKFGSYFANGVLVANCRYMVMSRFPAPSRNVRGDEMVIPWQRTNANIMSKEVPDNIKGDPELGRFGHLPVDIDF